VAFYQEVLGLETVRAYPTMAFLKAGELDSPLGHGGHPQLLVLFDRRVQLDIALTTLDHLAFEISLEHYPTERERLQQMGLEVTERIWQGEYAWLRAPGVRERWNRCCKTRWTTFGFGHANYR
jgi:catechol 2,3-dioxygenase-like lactoylglutathione lyase family enzyme